MFFKLASEYLIATCYMCYFFLGKKPWKFERRWKLCFGDTFGNHPNLSGETPPNPYEKRFRMLGYLGARPGLLHLVLDLHFVALFNIRGMFRNSPLVSLNKGLCIKPLFFGGWRPQQNPRDHPSIEPPSFIRATVAISRGPSEKHRWWRSESQHLRGRLPTIMESKRVSPPQCPSSRK